MEMMMRRLSRMKWRQRMMTLTRTLRQMMMMILVAIMSSAGPLRVVPTIGDERKRHQHQQPPHGWLEMLLGGDGDDGGWSPALLS
jgi:hypothetical protein